MVICVVPTGPETDVAVMVTAPSAVAVATLGVVEFAGNVAPPPPEVLDVAVQVTEAVTSAVVPFV